MCFPKQVFWGPNDGFWTRVQTFERGVKINLGTRSRFCEKKPFGGPFFSWANTLSILGGYTVVFTKGVDFSFKFVPQRTSFRVRFEGRTYIRGGQLFSFAQDFLEKKETPVLIELAEKRHSENIQRLCRNVTHLGVCQTLPAVNTSRCLCQLKKINLLQEELSRGC